MKILLLPAILLFGFVAHAQLLPVPGTSNPDWTLEKAEPISPNPRPVQRVGIDRMPNAAQKSIASSGNQHYHWDAKKQLVYTWLSRPGSQTIAPDKEVTVRDDRTDSVYTFRRAQPKRR
jgi:hypothetical protein